MFIFAVCFHPETQIQVAAQAGLANSLQPALDHLLKVFSTWAPGEHFVKMSKPLFVGLRRPLTALAKV